MSTTDSDFTPFPDIFVHCPNCGTNETRRQGGNVVCGACGFSFYCNPACAVGAVMVDPAGNLLFIRRAKNPSKGLLGMPGGFIDAGETAEEGLIREIREEIGVKVASLRYLASFPNVYRYQGVAYSVLDFFFVAFLQDFASATAEPEEVEEIVVLAPDAIDPELIAFPSMKKAVAFYLEHKDKLPH